MTGQIGDVYKYKGARNTIIARKFDLNFNPREYGLEPTAPHTACWRGYYCVYSIKNKHLYLEDLYIYCHGGRYPELFDVKAMAPKDKYESFYCYKGLNQVLKCNGSIVIGSDFIHDYYIHMGYQRAWAYRKVWELRFANGELVEEIDHSKTVQKIRDKIDRKNYKRYRPLFDAIDRGADDKELKLARAKVGDFVEDSFSLDPEVKAWWIEDV